ncbi:hypothetical protein ACN28G_19730 [Micromonospora sp. WMMA1923]|uniref:hypothetical protein n=1 Tax=Micromonospora sp. WMMA1923 TaxID=3404125 RepID=UPI003B95E8F1
MVVAESPDAWWAVGLPAGVRPGMQPSRSGEPEREPSTEQEREAAYTDFKLMRAELSLPARPKVRQEMSAEQRRAYLRRIGVLR